MNRWAVGYVVTCLALLMAGHGWVVLGMGVGWLWACTAYPCPAESE